MRACRKHGIEMLSCGTAKRNDYFHELHPDLRRLGIIRSSFRKCGSHEIKLPEAWISESGSLEVLQNFKSPDTLVFDRAERVNALINVPCVHTKTNEFQYHHCGGIEYSVASARACCHFSSVAHSCLTNQFPRRGSAQRC